MKKTAKRSAENLELSASHFTCMTNIGCQEWDIALYETLEGFRTADNILTTDGKQLIKMLTGKQNGESIKGKVCNVAFQEEAGKK